MKIRANSKCQATDASKKIVEQMIGHGTVQMSTDEIMALTRGRPWRAFAPSAMQLGRGNHKPKSIRSASQAHVERHDAAAE